MLYHPVFLGAALTAAIWSLLPSKREAEMRAPWPSIVLAMTAGVELFCAFTR